MKLLLPLFFGLTVASPQRPLVAPRAEAIDGVRIVSVSATGSGCPPGHASVSLDATGTIFDVAMDQYTVSVGPGFGPSDSRKNCRISLNLQYPTGYQFSIVETRFQGYASIPWGLTGTCRAAYTFSGQSGENVFRKDLPGSFEDNYEMTAATGVESYSRCGGSTAILNINSEARITPSDTTSRGFMTMDSIDGNVHLIARVNWRRC